MKRFFFPLILIALLAAACQSPAVTPTAVPPATSAPATSAPPTSVPPTSVPPTTAPTGIPPVTPPATATPAATDLPPAVDPGPAQTAAINALATKLQIGRDQITVVSTEVVDWPDGCLGIALPGVTCAKGPVTGFRIKLSAAARQYEYHTNQDGTSVLATDQALSQPLLVAVRLPDNSVKFVDTGFGSAGVRLNQGLLPTGGSAGGTAYVLDFQDQPRAQMVNAGGVNVLPFVQKPNYGLAVWPGNGAAKPRLAWATSPTSDTPVTQLFYANVDGTGLTTAVTETVVSGAPPYQLIAEAWSDDGQALYFSREPYGIGGYIPFASASSLYRYNLADGTVTTLDAFNFGSGGKGLCLDGLNADFSLAAGHCVDPKAVTLHAFTGGAADLTITAPVTVTEFRLAGSARFSPDGKRVAFALAKGDPTAEQGYVAVSAGLGGQSNFVTTSNPGQYFTVEAWLDNKTLLLQLNALACNPDCNPSLWTIGIDGASLTQLTPGNFLTLLAGNQ